MASRVIACAAAALLLALVSHPSLDAQSAADAAIIKRARAIHEKVIALDTHADINVSNFTAERNYTQRLDNQVNLPKMFEGGLDSVFFIVYVGQGPLTADGYERAYTQALARFEAIHSLTKEIAPDRIGLALTSADARRLNSQGRNRSRRHLVGFRRRGWNRRLERRERDLQRHAGTGAARLQRAADRQNLERQSSARARSGTEGRAGSAEISDEIETHLN